MEMNIVENKQPQSLKTQIQNQILESIFSAEFQAQQILTEKELTERYHCSKSPVREALVSLCSEGVLRSIPRCGYQVIQLTKDDIDEILSYRQILETGFLKSCYNRITPAQIDKLEAYNKFCMCQSENLKDHWVHNSNFHLYLISCSGNRFAYHELKRSMDILYRAYAQYYWFSWDDSISISDVRTHKKIIQCIRSKNVQDIGDIFEADLSDFAKYFHSKHPM